MPEVRAADYIVRNLIDYDDIAYDEQAELICDLAYQAVDYLKSYLDTESALHNVLANQGRSSPSMSTHKCSRIGKMTPTNRKSWSARGSHRSNRAP